jgi:thiol-disulfide isomerase/thioredoxin
VLDAATSRPIDNYTIVPITYGSKASSARGIAQPQRSRKFESSEFTLDDAFIFSEVVAFRIGAVGYEVFTTERFFDDSPPGSLTIRLVPAQIQSGLVIDSDGNPVAGAACRVLTSEEGAHIHNVENYTDELDGPVLTTDASGTFLYPTQVGRYAVLVTAEEGYAEKYLEPDEMAGEIVLQPWSRAEGQLVQAGKPVPDATITVRPIRALGGDNPHVQDSFSTATDAEGRFVFGRLPPVPSTISSQLTPWRDYPITSNAIVPVDLRPGETHVVNLGGDGLEVVGKVRLLGELANSIEFRYGINNLVSNVATVAVPAHATRKPEFDIGEQAEFDRRLWGDRRTADGKKSFFFKIDDDGTFHISGVEPGDYRLLIKLYEPPTGCLVDPVGYGFVEFSTDDYGINGETLDLGTIDIDLKPVPKVGDSLADFSYQDLDGNSLRVSDLRGKYVLLDFWATWCAPCVTAMPDIQSLHDEVGTEATILSVNIDKDIETAREWVRDKELAWQQGFVGEITGQGSGRALGLSSVPLYIVLNPQGKIEARTSNLAVAAEALRSHLKE